MIGSLTASCNTNYNPIFEIEDLASKYIEKDVLQAQLSDEFLIQQTKKLMNDFPSNETDRLEISTKPQEEKSTKRTSEKQVSPTIKALRKLFRRKA